VQQLVDSNGNLYWNKTTVLNIAHSFYQQLHKECAVDSLSSDFFLSKITRRIELHDDELTSPIAQHELYNAVKQMALGKTPGPGGLSAEFYLRCWDIIGSKFLEVINEMHASGNIPDKMKTGYVTLIHKNWSQKLQTNFSSKLWSKNIQMFIKSTEEDTASSSATSPICHTW